MSKDSNQLFKLGRYSHSINDNKELCTLLSIEEKAPPLKYMLWQPYENNSTPEEIESRLSHFMIVWSTRQFQHLIILTNNIFVLSHLNFFISSNYLGKNAHKYFTAYTYQGNRKLHPESILPTGMVIPKELKKMYATSIENAARALNINKV